ncbi:hypothetical protein [Sphingobacterium sp. WOUb80]|uniref:hypothetical protein n=1 Tax=Sphingobacterium sp. WOUb80 TaxID=3234028 RepID=UPI003CF74EDE
MYLEKNKMFSKIGIVKVALFSAGLMAIVACKDHKETIGGEEELKGTVLKVNISGIDESGKVSAVAKVASTTTGTHVSSGIREDEKLVTGGNFDALLSMDPVPASVLSGKRAATKTTAIGGRSLKAVTTPMPTNLKYRILLYDESGSTLLNNVVGTPGTDPAIQIDGGKTYRWVAVSTSEGTVPDLSNGKIAAADLANKDVLFATGTIDTKTGENYLNIIFDHKTARYDVDIDTRGLFGSINTLKSMQLGTGSGAQFKSMLLTADLDILSGTFGNPVAVAVEKTAAHIANTDASTGDLVKTVSLYTIPTGTAVTAGTISIQPFFSTNLDHLIMNLPVTSNEISTRNYGTANTYLTFANGAFTPEVGGQYQLKARIIESAIPVGGLAWARSDLWYDGTAGQLDKYRFKADAGIEPYDNATQSEYWTWVSTTPTGTPLSGDPCALVYPAGVWRMPNATEMNSLTERSSTQFIGISGSNQVDTYNWYAVVNQSWAMDNGAPSYAGEYTSYSQRLIFTFNGYYPGSTLTYSRKQIDSRSNTSASGIRTQLFYWAAGYLSTDHSKGAVMTQAAVYNYTKPFTYNLTQLGTRQMQALTQTYRGNVRCVRK